MDNIPLALMGAFVGGLVASYGVTYAVLIAIERYQLRRRRPDASGRCKVCGYDLRQSPFRCPECGKPVEE